MSDFLMAYMADPREDDQHRTFLLQKYILLHTQQESLRRRLSTASTTTSSPTSPTSPRSPAFGPSGSPLRDASSRVMSPAERMPSSPEADVENDQLRVVNQQLKTTLTELLNSDTAKHDASFRMWVQSRLMDAEMELKRQRRRMSSVGGDTMDGFRYGFQQSQSPPA